MPAVAQGTKMGYVFILDRETGAPLFPVEERPAPASDVPGETASPTQPVPVRPPAARAPAAPARRRLGTHAPGPRRLPRAHRDACAPTASSLRPAAAAASCIPASSAASPGAGWRSIPGPGSSSPIRTASRWWHSRPRVGGHAHRDRPRGGNPHRAAGARALRRPPRGAALSVEAALQPTSVGIAARGRHRNRRRPLGGAAGHAARPRGHSDPEAAGAPSTSAAP